MCTFILGIITCPDIMYETLVTSQQLHGAATVRNFQGWALVNNLMNLYCEKVESLCLIKHQAINTYGGWRYHSTSALHTYFHSSAIDAV